MKDKEEIKTDGTVVELSDIIREGLPSYTAVYGNLPQKHWKVINNICQCRTEKLGGHIYKCDVCDYRQVAFNSCRDRHCPKCQGVARAAWVEQRTSELLPVGYFHIVFTIPNQFVGYDLKNKKELYAILFRSISETLLDLGKDPRWLGGTIGFLAVLHSWGQQLLEHPHIHCLIPGGGIRLDGKKWVSFRNNYIFPVEVMSLVFRGKFLSYFTEAVESSRLCFPRGVKNAEDFKSFLNEQWKKNWVVYAKKPFGSPQQVVKYLGRYTHRIAISNKRIVSQKDGHVTFRWKDYADGNKQKLLTLDTFEFLRRFFLHILPEGFVRIRYYGLLSNGKKTEKMIKCFRLLNKKYKKKELSGRDIAAVILAIFGKDITRCPKCGKGHLQEVKEILKKPKQAFRIAA
jgi:hypothetical protein